MSKKTWILISCLVLSLTLGLGGSLAYLTDTDTKINTFTMGNVDIEVEEAFEQNSQLKPGVTINKEAKINNIGSNDAWVWMTVAVPAEIADVVTPNWTEDVTKDMLSEDTIKDEQGNSYKLYTVKWPKKLLANQEELATTGNLLASVTMAETVDYVDGEYYKIEGGERTLINYDLSNFDVIVSGYAIQTDGFESVDEAYKAYYTQWGDVELEVPAKAGTAEELAAAATSSNVVLNQDIQNVAQNIVFAGNVNGNGHEVKVDKYDYNSNCTFTMTNGTIENITILGAPRAIGTGSTGTYGLSGDLYINNVYVDGGTYGINIGKGNGYDVYVNNSEIYGWNSVADADVTIKNSVLGKRESTYMGAFAIHDDMTFDNCDFVDGYKFFGRSPAAGAKETAKIIINDCAYWYGDRVENPVEGTDFVRITADNFVNLLIDSTDSGNQYLKNYTIIVNGETVVW